MIAFTKTLLDFFRALWDSHKAQKAEVLPAYSPTKKCAGLGIITAPTLPPVGVVRSALRPI